MGCIVAERAAVFGANLHPPKVKISVYYIKTALLVHKVMRGEEEFRQ